MNLFTFNCERKKNIKYKRMINFKLSNELSLT